MVTATRFGGRRKWRLTGGFCDELEGGKWRAAHGGAVGGVWWAETHRGTHTSSPEWARDGELAAGALLVSEARQRGNGRVHSARGVAVDDMRALGADERGQEQRTDDKCHHCSAAGRPRWWAQFWWRQNNGRLTELLWQRISPKPERIRTWCSWQSWSTSRDLQLCQLEQKLDQLGLRGMKFSKSIEQTVCVPGLRKFSVLETAPILPCGSVLSYLWSFSWDGHKTTFVPYQICYNFAVESFDMQTFYETLFKSLSRRGF